MHGAGLVFLVIGLIILAMVLKALRAGRSTPHWRLTANTERAPCPVCHRGSKRPCVKDCEGGRFR
jgi:hypothetical protein